jgi:selenide,water dikinase
VDLDAIVRNLRRTSDPRLLVGTDTGDDAGVVQLRDDLAVVHTVDYIMPLTNDPYDFGRIAGANSISDVYAMGGTPVAVMNICAFPEKGPSHEELTRVLQGGMDIAAEAGAVLAGGHTVTNKELMYGLAVTGVVHPDEIWRNSTVREGDRLILTKPIGTGVVAQAHQKRKVPEAEFAEAVRQMSTLNRSAFETARRHRIHGATDVTGFGLAGHALGMATGAKVEVLLHLDAVPRYPSALHLIRKGVTTRSVKPNLQYCEPYLEFRDSLTEPEKILFFDPQTSGGLLLSVHPDDAEPLLSALKDSSVPDASIVGEVRPSDRPRLTITR